MKKPILILAVVLFYMASYAQSSKSDSIIFFKPQAGNLTTELNINPFNGAVNLNNSLNQIKFRYFISAGVALRLGFNISKEDSIYNISQPYGTTSYFYKNNKKSTTMGINLGLEKHFAGTRRLSPYVGAEVSLTNGSASQEINDNGSTTDVKNGWYEMYYTGTSTNYVAQIQPKAYVRYGVNLITGFDYYIARHFFFGYEFGFGMEKTNWKDVEVNISGTTSGAVVNTTSDNSHLDFGPSLMNGIRLGYTF
ncbi:hypothetical protein [Arcticibacter eurypsychrophilus]|uniref:hypothetical protein n=1 Tax=Arcticibacter eurypsychrophilus TaxID=1434752 RepID=UPI00084CEACF|nr:hypothetical protein [Arcticibacter eurypsychrophilus]